MRDITAPPRETTRKTGSASDRLSAPPPTRGEADASDFVLSRFRTAERPVMDDA